MSGSPRDEMTLRHRRTPFPSRLSLLPNLDELPRRVRHVVARGRLPPAVETCKCHDANIGPTVEARERAPSDHCLHAIGRSDDVRLLERLESARRAVTVGVDHRA